MVYINFNDTGEQDLIDEFDDGMQGFEFTPPTVLVCGVGGCGGNAVQNIASTGIKNVKFLAANTDGVALRNNINPKLSSLLLLGPNKLQGRGSGNNYEIAREAAEESYQLIKERLQKIQLLILIAGESKGTGTGATPVIAKCARELDKKIIAIVTTPFKNQQACAMNNAIEGINRLKEYVDCYIIIPNENLKRLNKPNIGMYEAQLIIDEKITEITKSIVDILVTPGYQNIDYSDIANTINQSGQAHIAFTRVEGTDKVDRAIEELSNNVLLDTSIVGARRIIIYITSPHDFTLSDHDKLVSAITGQAHPDVTVITGSRYDDDLGDAIEVTLIATSFDQEYLSHTNENVPVNEELDKKKIGFEGSTLSDQLIAPISETTYEELQEQPAHISEPVETEQIPELEPAISLPQPMIITAEHPVVSIPEPIPEPLRELSQATVNAPEKKEKVKYVDKEIYSVIDGAISKELANGVADVNLVPIVTHNIVTHKLPDITVGGKEISTDYEKIIDNGKMAATETEFVTNVSAVIVNETNKKVDIAPDFIWNKEDEEHPEEEIENHTPKPITPTIQNKDDGVIDFDYLFPFKKDKR